MIDDILGTIESVIARHRAGKIPNHTAMCLIRVVMGADTRWGEREAAAAQAKRELVDTIERIRG